MCSIVLNLVGSHYTKPSITSGGCPVNQVEIGAFYPLHQVKVSLDGLMEALLGLSDIGDCVARVDLLLGELKTLEDKAQVKIL